MEETTQIETKHPETTTDYSHYLKDLTEALKCLRGNIQELNALIRDDVLVLAKEFQESLAELNDLEEED